MKQLLIALVLVVLASLPVPTHLWAFSPVTLIGHGIGSTLSSGSAATAGLNMTGANFCAVVVTWFTGGTTPTLVDSTVATWTGLTQQTDVVNQLAERVYYASLTGTSGQTFTAAGVGSFPNVAVECFNNVGTLDVETGSTVDFNTSLLPGFMTPSANNEVVVTAATWNTAQSGSVTVDTGFTITDQANVSPTEGTGLAYLIQTGASAANVRWTGDTNSGWAATTASFTNGGGGGPTFPAAIIGNPHGGGIVHAFGK